MAVKELGTLQNASAIEPEKTPGVRSLSYKEASSVLRKKPSKGIIADIREARKQPTRTEQFIEKGIPGFSQAERAFSPYSALPTASRIVGEAADIPVDLTQALMAGIEKQGAYSGAEMETFKEKPSLMEALKTDKVKELFSPSPLPEGAERLGPDFIRNILANLTATATRPFESFRERPVQTVSEMYLGAQGIKGAVKGVGAAKKAVGKGFRTAFPKKDMYTLGRKAQTQLNKLRKEHGKAVGAERQAINNIKGEFSAQSVIDRMEQEITKAGRITFDPSDLKAFEQIKNKLKGGQAISAREIREVKDMINNRFVSYPKPGETLIRKTTPNAERIMMGSVDDIDKLLLELDQKFSNGRLAQVNAQYSKTSKAYQQAARELGRDLKLERSMGTIGKRLLEGDQGYVNLWNQIDEATGTNVMRDLEKVALKQQLARESGQSLIGQQARPLITGTRLLGRQIADVAKVPFQGPELFGKQFPGIKDVPYRPGLPESALLKQALEQRR